MEYDEIDFSFLKMILNEHLNNFCHCCIESMCNEALKSVYILQIKPEKMVECYLRFLKEKIINVDIECVNKISGCLEKIRYGELKYHLQDCKFANKTINLDHNIKTEIPIEEFKKFKRDIVKFNISNDTNGHMDYTIGKCRDVNEIEAKNIEISHKVSSINSCDFKNQHLSFSELEISSTSTTIFRQDNKKTNRKKKNKISK